MKKVAVIGYGSIGREIIASATCKSKY